MVFFNSINCSPLSKIFIAINKFKCIIYLVCVIIWLHVI